MQQHQKPSNPRQDQFDDEEDIREAGRQTGFESNPGKEADKPAAPNDQQGAMRPGGAPYAKPGEQHPKNR